MQTIYLDHSATSPLAPEVLEVMLPYLREEFANPSSTHTPGQRARSAREKAREQVAALLGAPSSSVVFTSGGTEADNLAILGGCRAAVRNGRAKHLIVSAIEHAAVREAAAALRGDGFEVDHLPVDEEGRARPEELIRLLRPDTALVSVMLASNETGVIQPVPDLARMARGAGALFHTDAVQAVGKMALSMERLGVDMLSVSAHKINGPKGAGALCLRPGTPCDAILHGGGQERNRRPGTENMPALVGFGEACRLARENLKEHVRHMLNLRTLFETTLQESVPTLRINGDGAERLPSISSLAFPPLEASALAISLDLAGVAVSTGSACSSGAVEPSPVLLAMGLPPSIVHSSVRFSLSRLSTESDVLEGASRVAACVEALRIAFS